MFHNNRFLNSTILCAMLAVPLAGAANAQTAPAAETKRPNAPDQKPAFEGQTRAPQAAAQPSIEKPSSPMVCRICGPWNSCPMVA